jgi:hypothetical protein
MLCDQDIFRFLLILPEPAEYFGIYFCSLVCIRIPIDWHPVITSEMHSYLQHSNCTFFPIYAYDYRQHMTSKFFTYPIIIKTHSTSTRLPLSQAQIINHKNRKSMLIRGIAVTRAAIH